MASYVLDPALAYFRILQPKVLLTSLEILSRATNQILPQHESGSLQATVIYSPERHQILQCRNNA
jgi:hypothetical protein